MKKFLRIVLVLIVVLIPFVSVDAKAQKTTAAAKNKVNFYLFYGDGCPHCEELINSLKSFEKDSSIKGMYNLVKLEVWNDATNSELMQNVAKALNTEASGVPFYVIGEKYFSGYKSSMDSEIKQAIKDAYNNDAKDIVASVNKGEIVTPGNAEEKDNSVTIAIIAISATVLLVLLIIFGRTSSAAAYYVDEEEDTKVVEVKEEKPVAKKAVAKKATATKATTKKPAAKKTQTAAKKSTKKTTTKKTTSK